jgi:predicted RNase H-like HicB family nuclease
MTTQYTMIIQWSDEDQLFVVSLPEFGPYCHTHGKSYEEAARMGEECLESLIEAFRAWGKPLPKPNTYPGNAKKKRTQRAAKHKVSA